MKRLVLTIILLGCNNLWGLKMLGGDVYTNREEWCLESYPSESSRSWCEIETPTLPNDYKPTKEDKVLKVKVGNVEGEIVGVKGKGIFIRTNSQKDFSYVDKLRNPSELFLVNYPQYSVMVQIDNSEDRNDGGGSVIDIYQIFEGANGLMMFLLEDKDAYFPWCNFAKNDSPCPFTKEYILDWIKKQGGQKFFDNACPAYYDDLNYRCDQGIIDYK